MTGRGLAAARPTAAERVYRVAFHAYPRRWRWVHQREALAVLLERADDRHGRASWADGLDLLVHGLAERSLGVVRGLRRLTPLAKIGLAVAVAAVLVTGVEVDLDAVRGPTQAQARAALPATAQVNTTRCPTHPPDLPDQVHGTHAVVHVLNHQLEPLDADRMLVCRWVDHHAGDPTTGVLTSQRLVTDRATVIKAQQTLNSLRHSWWFDLRGWDHSGGGTPGSLVHPVTELVFGSSGSAVAVVLPQPGGATHGSFSNGILSPGDDNTAADTLADRTVPHLLATAPAVPR